MAVMGWYGSGGGSAAVMWLFMGVFWLALIALIVWLVARLLPGPGGGTSSGRQESPEDLLDRMFAAGKIDEQTNRSRRTALGEMRTPS